MTIPADITRCCDGLCPERETCRRFTERFALPVAYHADTLHVPGPDGACINRIPTNPNGTTAMTPDPETAIAAYMQECAHFMQMLSLAHHPRALNGVPEATFKAALASHERVGEAIHSERLARAREWMTGAADSE